MSSVEIFVFSAGSEFVSQLSWEIIVVLLVVAVVLVEESLSFFAVATMEAAFNARNVEMNSFIVMKVEDRSPDEVLLQY